MLAESLAIKLAIRQRDYTSSSYLLISKNLMTPTQILNETHKEVMGLLRMSSGDSANIDILLKDNSSSKSTDLYRRMIMSGRWSQL